MKVVVLLLVVVTAMQTGRVRGSPRTLPEGGLVKQGERRLCGWRLANELNRVCKGVYNVPTVSTNALFYLKGRGGKRVDLWPVGGREQQFPSRTHAPADDLRASHLSEPHLFQRPADRPPVSASGCLLTGAEASQVVVGRSPRVKRGLSAECCRKACSVSELAGYCY
ncbi:LOW QUALITY PROTEIN: LIRP-like [Portunus trituberculatus]|uniref:LOW QUALITY PROTEIN: LIRP-like n=1 Tax=Portunus trituberculatus TaxID=210409 RepID=UPI001E1CF39F|nr:LOW QUALITY PROTEIN: LIRP-like [Portunus trituberculatus]